MVKRRHSLEGTRGLRRTSAGGLRRVGVCVPTQLGSVGTVYAAPVPPRTGRRRVLRGGRSGVGNPARVEDGPGLAWSPGGPVVRSPKMARLEAVLFLANEPLTCRKLSRYANLADGTEARTLLNRLNEEYDREGRAFRVVEVAGGMQLLTRPKFAEWLRRLGHVPREERLSAPAMETLAVVAYRQPVVRAEIEAVRGVACGEILRQLMDRDLVRVSGRSEDLGRPYVYSTTKRFLQLFGLRSCEDLPKAEIFTRHGGVSDSSNPSNDSDEIGQIGDNEDGPDEVTSVVRG